MDRLEAFVRATSSRAPGVNPARVIEIVRAILGELGAAGANFVAEGDDRGLVKAAALGLAFCQEIGQIARGEFELDFREEAILDAVVENLKRGGGS